MHGKFINLYSAWKFRNLIDGSFSTALPHATSFQKNFPCMHQARELQFRESSTLATRRELVHSGLSFMNRNISQLSNNLSKPSARRLTLSCTSAQDAHPPSYSACSQFRLHSGQRALSAASKLTCCLLVHPAL